MKTEPRLASRFKTAVGVILLMILLALPEYSRLCGDDIPRDDSKAGLIQRTYKVGIHFFEDTGHIFSKTDKHTYDVRTNLIRRGIKFTSGASATYTPSTEKFVLINDPDQIALYEELVNSDR
jgi:hypothetical protein